MIHAYAKKIQKGKVGIEEQLFLSLLPQSLSLTQWMPFLYVNLAMHIKADGEKYISILNRSP